MTANLVNIKIWHDALVSGQYPQTNGTLVRNGEYCCLGVAVHEGIKHGLTSLRLCDDGHGFERTDAETPYTETDILPKAAREWLGIEQGDPELLAANGERVSASSLNDELGATFQEIAECIERTWPDAFVEVSA